jgi:hypothetical protein
MSDEHFEAVIVGPGFWGTASRSPTQAELGVGPLVGAKLYPPTAGVLIFC